MKYPKKPDFSARGSRCPICKQNFRDPDSCPHSISQAVERIERDHLRAVIRYELAKEDKRRRKVAANDNSAR